MGVIGPPPRRPSFIDVVRETVDPRPLISDAYWSVTHPRDRIMGRGRARNQQMMFPFVHGSKMTPTEFKRMLDEADARMGGGPVVRDGFKTRRISTWEALQRVVRDQQKKKERRGGR